MATAVGYLRALLLCVAINSLLLSCPADAQTSQYGQKIRSRATFYGGADAAGTMGGACGYGNLWSVGYGDKTAAASIAMWNSGAICGSCWKVKCVLNKEYCIPGASVIVTVTNQCPQDSEGGWCNWPQNHLDMAAPAWRVIANNFMGGIVETEMSRVPCRRKGGISVIMSGNIFFTSITVYNVAGSGDIMALSVSADNGRTWEAFSRNWGEVWSGHGYQGKELSFKFTNGMVADTLIVKKCVPSNWYFGGTYECRRNFRSGKKGGKKIAGTAHS